MSPAYGVAVTSFTVGGHHIFVASSASDHCLVTAFSHCVSPSILGIDFGGGGDQQ